MCESDPRGMQCTNVCIPLLSTEDSAVLSTEDSTVSASISYKYNIMCQVFQFETPIRDHKFHSLYFSGKLSKVCLKICIGSLQEVDINLSQDNIS